jgi:hypothetical protein
MVEFSKVRFSLESHGVAMIQGGVTPSLIAL